MELHRERPPAYFSHDPEALKLPPVPRDELRPASRLSEVKLPHIRSILPPELCDATAEVIGFRQLDATSPTLSSSSSRTLPRIDATNGYTNGTRASIESVAFSPTESGSAMSMEDAGRRSTSVVSLDDPDVRMAAEALSGLGNPDFVRASPRTSTLVSSYASSSGSSHVQPTCEEAEPLLELLAQAHPWVAGTVNGSMTAYSTTKFYSPRIVQYGANLVERNIGNPMVSTVSSVGRMTGVESGLRRYLGGGRPPSDLEHGSSGPSKRRRLEADDAMEIERSHDEGTRRASQDSTAEPLPLYRSSKPPSYREESSPVPVDRTGQRPQHNRSWSMQAAGQIFATTSGLTVALHERSRQSLRFCLTVLSGAAEHVENVMSALSMVLRDYDQARESYHRNNGQSVEKGEATERALTPDNDSAARQLADLIKRHSDDIWQTLKQVVNSISTYAGGALPDNARNFVRSQLMSLPQRWRVASDGSQGESETSRGAHRMIAFATEGLDMMSQVSSVMKGTLESAEKWLAMTGRKSRREEQQPVATHGEKADQEMLDVVQQT